MPHKEVSILKRVAWEVLAKSQYIVRSGTINGVQPDMKKRYLTVIPAMLWGLSALANPGIELDVSLPKHVIIPGEPAYMLLSVANISDSPDLDYEIQIDSRYDIEVKLFDEHENLVGERPQESWYPSGSGFRIDKVVAAGTSFRKTMILHRWHSTWLEPGLYTLEVRVRSFRFRLAGGQSSDFQREAGPREKFSFPIEILQRNDKAVERGFQELLNTVLRATPQSEEEERKKRLAADTIIFAQGSIALPFQLKLVEGLYSFGAKFETSENRFFEMFRYVAHSGNDETAKQLVEFANSPIFADCRKGATARGVEGPTYVDRRGAWKYLVFAIHELSKSGTPSNEIRSFVETIPPPRGISEYNYIDGGMGRQEDY